MLDISVSSIAVVGTIRNCERTVEAEYKRLKEVLSDFKQVRFFVVESDSEDQSVNKLESLKSSDELFDYVSLGSLKKTIHQRTARISFCRNKYIEELQNNPKYISTDYVLVVDFDGVLNLLSKEGVLSCWDFEGWDVCTANQKDRYYDVWALRHPLWSPNDCWKEYDFLRKELKKKSTVALRKAVRSRQLHVPKSSKPIEVESAFGGAGVYKKKAIIGSQYVGLDEHGDEMCEHVSFHSKMRENGFRIFINPKFINGTAPKEHVRNSRIVYIKKVARFLFSKITN